MGVYGVIAYLSPMDPQRILVIQTAFIGDAILATALLEKLHNRYPDARLDIMVRKGNEVLFKGHPFLDEVLVWSKRERKYKNLLNLIVRVRAKRYDLVINLQRFFATGLVTVLSGAVQTVGFKKNPLSFAYTKSFDHRIGDGTHEVQRNLSLISEWTDDAFQRPCLYPSPTEYSEGCGKSPYVCIAPTSVWYTKQWPAERWVALINTMPGAYSVYLLGAPSDRQACNRIAEAASHPGVVNRAGDLSLLASAALMRGAVMNYTNDSAPMHLASAVNAPVTAVFCSTVPSFGFGPLSDHSEIWQTHHQLDCRPCGLHGHRACPQGHFRCAEIAVPGE